MRNRLKLLLMVSTIPFGLMTASLSKAEITDRAPITITITGAGVEGYFKVVVETMSSILRDAYPGSAITFKPSSPVGGLQMIADGKADISVAFGAPELRAAFDGAAPFRTSLSKKISWLMRTNNEQYIYTIASREWAEKYGISSFEDIGKKKPPFHVANNRKGNLQTIEVVEDIYRANGFSSSDLEKWGGSTSWVASSVGLDQLADGKVDSFCNARFLPDAIVSKISSAKGLIWLATSPEKLDAIAKKWGYEVSTIPANTYGFIRQDTPILRQWSGAAIGNHVAGDVAYKVIKALAENAERMRAVHPSLKNFALKEMAINPVSYIPYHPGAARYYEEHRVLH